MIHYCYDFKVQDKLKLKRPFKMHAHFTNTSNQHLKSQAPKKHRLEPSTWSKGTGDADNVTPGSLRSSSCATALPAEFQAGSEGEFREMMKRLARYVELHGHVCNTSLLRFPFLPPAPLCFCLFLLSGPGLHAPPSGLRLAFRRKWAKAGIKDSVAILSSD